MTSLPHHRTTAPRVALLAAVALTAAGPVVAPAAATPRSVAVGDHEEWEQDSFVLDQTAGALLNDGEPLEQLTVVAVDHDDQIVHHAYRRPAGDGWLLAAFDLRAMSSVGDPQLLSGDAGPGPPVAFFDSSGGRLFVRSSSGAVDTFYRWDPVGRHYVTGTAQPLPLASTAALWDPIGERAVSMERRPVTEAGPDDDLGTEWFLHVHVEAEPGVWTDEVHPVPAPPGASGLAPYRGVFDAPTSRAGAVLSDGSLLLGRGTGSGPDGGAVPGETEPAALQQLVIGPDSVTATEVTPAGPPGLSWSEVHTNAAGDVALLSADRSSVLNLRLEADGSLQAQGESVEVGPLGAAGPVLDPVDGTTWVGAAGTQELAALHDGEVVYRGSHTSLHPDEGVVAVGDDHAVYAVTSDGEPAPADGGQVYGIGRFERASPPPPGLGAPGDEEAPVDESEPPGSGPEEGPDPRDESADATPGENGSVAGRGGALGSAGHERGFWWTLGPLLGRGRGELVWEIAATGHEVKLGTTEDRGEVWYATGELLPVTVVDTRAGGPAWSLSGGLGELDGGLSGEHLGWAPRLLTRGAGAVPGEAVPPGPDPGPGLSGPSLLASSPGGHDPGSATVGALLELQLPKDTPAGTYTATLTVTALG